MKSESISTAKLVGIVIVLSVIVAVLATLVQVFILGKSNAGVTGGVVGALTAGIAVSVLRSKKTGST